MGLFDTTRTLASLWIQNKKRSLQATPDTRVDSGGSNDEYRFQGQDINASKLRDIKDIRESGGAIAQLVHAKALMQFGTGVEWESENDAVVEWLESNLNDIDTLLLELGEDAIWYPYSVAEIVETAGGGFSHIEPIEPWTMLPQTNEYGEIIAWEQHIDSHLGDMETFSPDEIASFVLNKSSARDKTGVSEVLRAEEEIRQFRENRKAVNQAIEIAGFPHHVWKIGNENGSVIDDNELRRIRNMVDSMEGDTQFVVGNDVNHEMIEPGSFDFSQIQEHDLRELALSLGLPLELANVGSDGLGSGMPADLRLQLFERQARAAQRTFADQFVQEIARTLLEKYSPFSGDENLELVFGDPVSDQSEKASVVQTAGEYMTLNEKRAMLDLPPEEDEELGESYRKPANIQAPEEESDDGFGGLFNEEKQLETGQVEEWETALYELHKRTYEADSSRALLETADHATPEFAKERLKDAIRSGSVFSEFEHIPSSELMQLRSYLIEELENERWNIDGIANRLQDLDGDMTQAQAERVARTETASTVNTARELGYKERGLGDAKFKWVGSINNRTTDTCKWLLKQTNPKHGGTPVSLEKLRALIEEAPSHDDDMADNMARPDNYLPHINCRKTYVRHVE